MLLAGRIIRLAGAGFLVFWILSISALSVAGFSGPEDPLVSGPVFVIVLIVSLMLFPLGAGMLWIGEQISGPDPWLDTWLTPWRPYQRRSTVSEPRPDDKPGLIWAAVTKDRDWGQQPGIRGRCFVEFERGHLYLGQLGRDLELVEPKTILRTNDTTLQIDTGRWNYGKVTLTFDSPVDADKVQQKATIMLTHDAV